MKREAINANEAQMNEDSLLPLIDDMIQCRKEGLEQVKEMFGVDIGVEFASSWEDNRIELPIEQEQLISESEQSEGEETDIEETKYLDSVTDVSVEENLDDAIQEVMDLVQPESDSDENCVSESDNRERDND
jgi:hypothetical protein